MDRRAEEQRTEGQGPTDVVRLLHLPMFCFPPPNMTSLLKEKSNTLDSFQTIMCMLKNEGPENFAQSQTAKMADRDEQECRPNGLGLGS